MVDSNDRDRIGEARDELHRMLNEASPVTFLQAQHAKKKIKTQEKWEKGALDPE